MELSILTVDTPTFWLAAIAAPAKASLFLKVQSEIDT
jgi:hypothetical protein